MPDRLSLRSTLLLIVLAFGLTFTIQALLGGGTSAAKPLAAAGAPVSVAAAPGAEPNLSLAAAETVPALRNPRPPARKKRRVRKVRPAATVAPTPVASVSPKPTATPQYVAPAPKRKPTPTPKPKPTPTSTPEVSGEFDSSGEGGS
jgi:outer membrane biosynthesis protein TonB